MNRRNKEMETKKKNTQKYWRKWAKNADETNYKQIFFWIEYWSDDEYLHYTKFHYCTFSSRFFVVSFVLSSIFSRLSYILFILLRQICIIRSRSFNQYRILIFYLVAKISKLRQRKYYKSRSRWAQITFWMCCFFMYWIFL